MRTEDVLGGTHFLDDSLHDLNLNRVYYDLREVELLSRMKDPPG